MCPTVSPVIVKLRKMSSVTSAIGEKLICQICGFQTLEKTHLKLHEQAVHDGKKFKCPECEYQATENSILVEHKQSVHMGQKFKCTDWTSGKT